MNEREGGTSASQALADSLCPGRHKAQDAFPDTYNKDATFGIEVHEAVATGDDEGLKESQQSITDACREIEEKLVDQIFGPDKAQCKVFREQRFWTKVPSAADATTTYLHSAKPDVVYRLGPVALDLEFKALPGVQESAAQNPQIRDQSVLIARSLMVKEVYAAIVQPLVTHHPDMVLYKEADIAQAEAEMDERVRKSNSPTAPRVAGVVQCKFCKAKATCKEYAQWAKVMVPAPVSLFDTPVATWTAEQCATFCERKAVAEKWLDECTAHIKDRLTADPEAVPGWYLEPGSNRETINDLNELFARFSKMGGTSTDFLRAMKLNKGVFTAFVRTLTKAKGKALEKKLSDLFRDIIDYKQDAPSLSRKPVDKK